MARRPGPPNVNRTCYFVGSSAERDPTIFEVVRDAAGKNGLETTVSAATARDYNAAPASLMADADIILADYSSHDPEVLFELGMAQALEKPTLCIFDVDSPADMELSLDRIRRTFDNLEVVPYHRGEYHELFSQLDSLFERREAAASRGRRGQSRVKLPFFIDWDILEPSEIENLCQELLVQMGFRRVKWGETLGDIDLIAELPRKDPDDFEFRELWLVTMGIRRDPRNILEMASEDPDHFLYRTTTYTENAFQLDKDRYVSLLVISPHEIDLSRYEDRIDRSFRRSKKYSQFRIRIWDRLYLTSLVQKFPNLAYKYFSDEGRSKSKIRKSVDELYKENVDLVDRLAVTNKQLNEEKDKRVRAERDAVWKDISFSAAHKLGNPIFAIETGLEPFIKRVKDGRLEDALAIADLISRSVNKAKLVIEQFKSLAKSEQIDAVATNISSIIENERTELVAQEINCETTIPPTLMVVCDAEKISECLDELAMNAVRWMEKSGKPRELWKIEITAAEASDRQLPSSLEKSRKYAVVNFRDNGTGVPIEQKKRIFDAFITDHEHGTGLGLALVRRIVDGHGGAIIEVGKPAEGADFEFYLPLAPTSDVRLRPKTTER